MAAPLAQSSNISSIAGVFRGREITRKQRRLSAVIGPIDRWLQGGIPRGRISEFTGGPSSGKSSLGASFIIAASRAGETVAIVDLPNAFDPASIIAGGGDARRILWVNPPMYAQEGPCFPSILKNCLKATELLLAAGGFGLIVLDLEPCRTPLAPSVGLRLARLAERAGSALIILARRPLCGTFAALSLELRCTQPLFNRDHIRGQLLWPRAGTINATARPALFNGIEVAGLISRNKLGPCARVARWHCLTAPIEPSAWRGNGLARPLARRA
ncbi:MAG TPA: ATPase domain-containing protein [Candidatus Binataceae bacterium]|nr:ATPase domain-containing protein [Candidatus Binataceae bacterium]